MTTEPAQIEVLLPTPVADSDAVSETFAVGGPIAGVKVGLRADNSWRSWFAVIEEWERLLRRDGAHVQVLLAGDRAGPAAEQTRADVEEWARLIECGVIGLGN